MDISSFSKRPQDIVNIIMGLLVDNLKNEPQYLMQSYKEMLTIIIFCLHDLDVELTISNIRYYVDYEHFICFIGKDTSVNDLLIKYLTKIEFDSEKETQDEIVEERHGIITSGLIYGLSLLGEELRQRDILMSDIIDQEDSVIVRL